MITKPGTERVFGITPAGTFGHYNAPIKREVVSEESSSSAEAPVTPEKAVNTDHLKGATASRGVDVNKFLNSNSREATGVGTLFADRLAEARANKTAAVSSARSAPARIEIPIAGNTKIVADAKDAPAIAEFYNQPVSRLEVKRIIADTIQSELRGTIDYTVTAGQAPVLTLVNGRAVWAAGGNGGVDYDHVYIGGIEYTPTDSNPNDYDYLMVGDDGSAVFIPAMISPMPTGYEIYNIRKNHIHITGATAGNQ
jgi:hypothetical protein